MISTILWVLFNVAAGIMGYTTAVIADKQGLKEWVSFIVCITLYLSAILFGVFFAAIILM